MDRAITIVYSEDAYFRDDGWAMHPGYAAGRQGRVLLTLHSRKKSSFQNAAVRAVASASSGGRFHS